MQLGITLIDFVVVYVYNVCMKKIYTTMLKKFTVEDIIQMRDMKREGIPQDIIAKTFNCAITTALWHTGDINQDNYRTVEIL